MAILETQSFLFRALATLELRSPKAHDDKNRSACAHLGEANRLGAGLKRRVE
jgi:hypothetical protein